MAVSLDAAERFFALLAIVAGLGAICLAVARGVPGARRMLRELAPSRLWLAWLVAATSMVGSLYFSESQGFEPCQLCWYQRIAMYSLAIILLVAAIRKDHTVARYAVPLAGIGFAISVYHRLIEAHPSWESSGTCSISVPCTTPYFHVFEIFTLALMAACGFAAILALLLFVPAPSAAAPSPDESSTSAAPSPDELVSR